MEAAPLSQAYSHARNAIKETQKANPIAASEEHDLAAGEFANAAKSTGDPEALRTLRLLEQYHQHLAELLKERPKIPPPAEEADAKEAVDAEHRALTPVSEEPPETPRKESVDGSPSHVSKQPSSESRAHRDLSSSIASNLATARGIQPRQQRRSLQSSPSNLQNDPSPSSTKRSSRGYERRPPPLSPSSTYKSSPSTSSPARVSPTHGSNGLVTRDANIPPSIVMPGSDDAFTRFYSTVESLGTKLSAALAFTGLPLGSPAAAVPSTADTKSGLRPGHGRPYTAPSTSVANAEKRQPPRQPPTLSRDNSRTTPAGSPDVSRFFSRAAIRAVRGDGGGVADSFYVVPTSGGTLSYAGMLGSGGQGQAKAPGHMRQGSNFSNAEDEEFVDASEGHSTAGSFDGQQQHEGHMQGRSRAGSSAAKGGGSGNTRDARSYADLVAELNHWKAQAAEKGERLRAFEMNAQRESIMAASIYRGGGAAHGTRPSSPVANLKRESTKTSDASSKEDRSAELEKELEAVREEAKKLQRENRKLLAVVEKYRRRFIDLKEGAKERLKREGESTSRGARGTGRDDESARNDQMLS